MAWTRTPLPFIIIIIIIIVIIIIIIIIVNIVKIYSQLCSNTASNPGVMFIKIM